MIETADQNATEVESSTGSAIEMHKRQQPQESFARILHLREVDQFFIDSLSKNRSYSYLELFCLFPALNLSIRNQ